MPENPAAWIDMKAQSFEKPRVLSCGRHPSLPYNRMPAFTVALRKRSSTAARALELLILTNARTDAVIRAKWREFDGDLWTIPLARLKDSAHRSEPFRIPLTPRAVEVVREMTAQRAGRFVFAGQKRGEPLSNMALLSVVKRMNAVAAPETERRTRTDAVLA